MLSKLEAEFYHSTTINTLHVLLGILREGDNKGVEALRKMQVSLESLEQLTRNRISRSDIPEETISTTLNQDGILMDEACNRVMRMAFLEARLYQSSQAEADHMLLAILRDRNNAARQVLNDENVTYEGVANAMNMRPDLHGRFGFTEENGNEEFPTDGGENAGFDSTTSSNQTQTRTTSDTPTIDKFGVDLIKAAEKGKLDPVVGREREIERIAQILSRRKKNNPILIGEPGVGKSAIVEGLAQQISRHQTNPALLNKRIVALDMTTLVAGTQYRGQFEERMRRLMNELQSHPEIILFIDEIHTIIGAGSNPGGLDAANILKPALARGEMQCIGATTINEFKKTIEKDGALDRRFQKVLLEPTTTEETLQILKNIKDRYEEHHHVKYTDAALEACVRLTERYITDRALPDKAIDAMDEAGSRRKLGSIIVPKEIRDKQQEIDALKEQKRLAADSQNYELAAEYRDRSRKMEQELEQMNQEWQESFKGQQQTVTEADIAEVVSMMSGVPATQMAQSEGIRLKGLRDALQKRIIGQDKAIEKIVRSITRNRIGLKDPNRPIGTFMFVGPTGVGKTYLVQSLAEYMFGSRDALIRIDMSEYGEKYSTSRLVGAPPGYVGYEEGGQLTEKVRRHPYSIILLDEIEKAHPDVFNTLLQVMDEGRMTDGNGTTVDFRNTVIVMTSNSGTRQLKDFGGGIGFTNSRELNPDMAESIVRKSLQKQFAPEFLNRVDDIVMFQPLNDEHASKIARLEFDTLALRVKDLGYELQISDEALQFLVKKGFDTIYGARSLKRALQEYVEDPLSDILMELSEESPSKVFRIDKEETEKLKVVPVEI